MADQPSLLPRNGTPLLRAMEQALAYEPRLVPAIDLIPDIKGRRLPSFLQFLLFEYGLIELTPYVQNPHALLDTGRQWQIERDTFAAIARGLGWVQAPATIAEAPFQRSWWNSFQLYLDALPAADAPNLDRIDRVTELSKPFRSDFRRGVNGYDVAPLEGDQTRLDYSHLDRESGVRLRAGGPLWSFGRAWEMTHVLTEAEGTALGNWITPDADVEFLADLIELTISIDGTVSALAGYLAFSRASGKWAQDLAGGWHYFAADALAHTDRGTSLEPAATRLTFFNLAENPLAADDPDSAATIVATDLADPLGGASAIRVQFDGSAGRTLLVPASGLAPETSYGVSFFAKLVSSTGSLAGAGDAGMSGFFGQLVAGEWVRVEGAIETGPAIDGEWLDLTLDAPGATALVELAGFQVEAGIAPTSPISGALINGTRAADNFAIELPGAGSFDLVIKFDDGTAQPLYDQEIEAVIYPATLARPYVTEISTQKPGTWLSMAFPWIEADFPWISAAEHDRATQLGEWFEGEHVYHFALKRANGSVIGYRRARGAHRVTAVNTGRFSFGDTRYSVSPVGQAVLFEAMTDAGNGAGEAVASVALVVDGALAPGVPPGRLWLAPNQLSGGTAIAPASLSIPLRATVRERLKLMLRF